MTGHVIPIPFRRIRRYIAGVSHRNFRVGRSSTGLGLFATEPIRKGAFIVAYIGRRISNAEAERIELRGGNRYMFGINDRWTIDGSSRRNLARYLNHACRPNAEARYWRQQMRIVAVRRIEPDEEITFDYGKEYFDLFLGKDKCRCESCLRRRAKHPVSRRAPRNVGKFPSR